jgi:hypothetical protein
LPYELGKIQRSRCLTHREFPSTADFAHRKPLALLLALALRATQSPHLATLSKNGLLRENEGLRRNRNWMISSTRSPQYFLLRWQHIDKAEMRSFLHKEPYSCDLRQPPECGAANGKGAVCQTNICPQVPIRSTEGRNWSKT